MKKTLVLILLAIPFLQGCFDYGHTFEEPDTPVYFTNQSADTLTAYFNGREANSKTDTLISDEWMNAIIRYDSITVLAPDDTIVISSLFKSDLESGRKFRSLYLVVEKDSLEQLPREAIQKEYRGVTWYSLETLEEYEEIGFVLVWPKK